MQNLRQFMEQSAARLREPLPKAMGDAWKPCFDYEAKGPELARFKPDNWNDPNMARLREILNETEGNGETFFTATDRWTVECTTEPPLAYMAHYSKDDMHLFVLREWTKDYPLMSVSIYKHRGRISNIIDPVLDESMGLEAFFDVARQYDLVDTE